MQPLQSEISVVCSVDLFGALSWYSHCKLLINECIYVYNDSVNSICLQKGALNIKGNLLSTLEDWMATVLFSLLNVPLCTMTL